MLKKIFFLLLISTTFCQAQKYKEMMEDYSINFYDVVTEAENYFQTHDKNVKGSGWKPYQRWKYENEIRYYPSGDRFNIDKRITNKVYSKIKKAQKGNSTKSLVQNEWKELGPAKITEITHHFSPGLGRVYDFYVDKKKPDTLFLASAAGGFSKTVDGGLNWSNGSTDLLPATGVNTIAVNPFNANEILISVRNAGNGATHGIYRSTDMGETWQASNFVPSTLGWGGLGQNHAIYRIVYHPTVENLVFVSTSKGFFRSTDNLSTWTKLQSTHKVFDVVFHPTDPNYVYYSTSTGGYRKNLYISNDKGLTFSSTEMVGNTKTPAIKVSNSCPDCVYLASKLGIWKTTDKGATITRVLDAAIDPPGFAVSDTDDNYMMHGYLDARRSIDGGVSFSPTTSWNLAATNGSGNGHQISFNTSTNYIHADLQRANCYNGVFYAATDGFLVKSEDNGISWSILSNGTPIRMNYNLGVSQSNYYKTICGSQDNGISIMHKDGWREFYGSDGMEGIIHPLNDNWMIGSTQRGNRVQTFTSGIGSKAYPTPPGQTGSWIAPMLYNPNNQMTIYSFGTHVYKSDKFGATGSWVDLGDLGIGKIQQAAIAENDSNIMIVARGNNIRKTTDGGATWVDIKNNLPTFGIADVTFDPKNDNNIFVVYGDWQDNAQKVYMSNDGGTSWDNITFNLNSMPIKTVLVDDSADSNIYLGAEIGVYKKKLTDNTWTLYNNNLPNTTVHDMEIIKGANTLRVATWGRGLWEIYLPGKENYPKILTTKISNPVTFTNPKTNHDQYVTSEIEYSSTLTNVEVRWSINNPTFGNIIPMSNTGGNKWESDAPIANQPEGTKIFFKVVATGSNNDTSETYKFNYKPKEDVLCEAKGDVNNTNLRIKNVTIKDVLTNTELLNNTTNQDIFTYYDATAINLVKNRTYEISVSANTGWTHNDYGVWLDYNDDYEFTSDEKLIGQVNPGVSNVSTQFTVPAYAKMNSDLRLRVRLGYYSYSVSPCGVTYGEVEDYRINVVNPNVLNMATSEFGKGLKIFPNPTTGKLQINLGKTYTNTTLTLTNVLGQNVFNKTYNKKQYINLNVKANSGVYFLTINSDGNPTTVKIIKE